MKEVLKEGFEKLKGFNRKWTKRVLAFVLCLTITFATMPTWASDVTSSTEAETEYDYGISLPMLDDEDYENIQQSEVEVPDDEEGDIPESSVVEESSSDFESSEDVETDSSTVLETETTTETMTETETKTETETETSVVIETETAPPIEVTKVKVVIGGLIGMDTSKISFVFMDMNEGGEVTKNADGTYDLVKGCTYQVTNIIGYTGGIPVEINGKEINDEFSFVYDGENSITITFFSAEHMVTEVPVEFTVVGPDDQFNSMVDQISFSLTAPSGDEGISFTTSGGSATVTLVEGNDYELHYSGIAGYYLTSMTGVSIPADNKSGNDILYTCDGNPVTIRFAAVPKMYATGNGDYSLKVDTFYDLLNEYGMSAVGGIYNDGGLISVCYDADHPVSFVESAVDANAHYLVLHPGAYVSANLTNSSSAYLAKVVYSASSNGTAVNPGMGVYGSAISQYDGTASSRVIDSLEYYKLLEPGKHYTFGGNGNIAIQNMTLYQVEEKTLTGQLLNVGSMLTNTTTITYTNSAYGIVRTATVQTDGSYTISLPATTEGLEYKVTLANDAPVSMLEVVNTVKIYRDSADAGAFEVEAFGAVEFTFSSQDAGFATVSSAISAVNVTLNRTTTKVSKGSDGTFKTSLTLGQTYKFAVEGVPAYEVVAIVANGITTSGNAYVYTGGESTIELVMGPKSSYKVYFDILAKDQAILTAKNIDFADGNYTFTFTNGNNVATPAVQKDASGRYYVELCVGDYEVSLTGSGMDALPYVMSSTALSVMDVNEGLGEENLFYFSMDAITKWTFSKTGGFEVNLNGTSAYWQGLFLDATSGKIQLNQDKQAVMNAGTVVHVPVSGPSTVTITAYDSGYGAKLAVAAGQTGASMRYDGAKAIINYTGTEAYVKFTASAQTYFYTVEVKEGAEEIPEEEGNSSEWYFYDDGTHEFYNDTIQSRTGEYKGLLVDATSGKLAARQPPTYADKNDTQMNAGTIISIPVTGECTITITATNTSNAAKLCLDGSHGSEATWQYDAANAYATVAYTGGEGYVKFGVSSGSSYIKSIIVEYPEVEEITEWYFDGTGEVSYQNTIQNKEETWKNLTINATASGAKLAFRTSDSQMNKDTRITIPVSGECTIAVKSYYGSMKLYDGSANVDAVADATIATATESGSSKYISTVTYTGSGGNVTIAANQNDYLYYIKIAYPSSGTDEVYTKWHFKDYGDGEPYFSDTLQGSSGTGTWRGLQIDATAGKLGGSASYAQMNQGTLISIPVTEACSIAVTAHDANYANGIDLQAGQSNVSLEKKEGNVLTYKYTGGRGYVTIEAISNTYIHKIEILTTITDESTLVEDDKLPRIAKDNELFGSKGTVVEETVDGQRITVKSTGGQVFGKWNKGDSTFNKMGYYIFESTTGYDTLSFDMTISQNNTKSWYGVFPGIFSSQNAYTISFRNDGKLERVYSTDSLYTTNSAIGTHTAGDKIHIEITRTGDATCTISYESYTDEAFVGEVEYSMLDSAGTDLYFGLAITEASVEISNLLYMKRSSAGGTATEYYDQNDEYAPVGTVPTVRALYAVAADVDGASVVKLSILGDTPTGDAFYFIERSEDNGATWKVIKDTVYGVSCIDDTLIPGQAGTYIYRVTGQLGRPSLGGTKSTPVVSKSVVVDGALEQPELTAVGSSTGVTLTWEYDGNYDYFTIYRYSYDTGYDGIEVIRRKETGFTFTDSIAEGGIIADDPYYYIVQAVLEATDTTEYNESLLTEDSAVWAVPVSNRTGYDYEKYDIVITNRSYQTVFTNKILIEGLVDGGNGTITAYVNGAGSSKQVADREAFSFELTLNQGRNDVYLEFTGADGVKAKKAFNYIYATDYDAIVDASFTGTDGEVSTIATGASVPTYKTVTAAVEAAPTNASSSNRHVILVLEGSYEERLIVNKSYITLLGEEPEKTSIHYYPGVLGSEYEAGGDMSLRCATYIQAGATGFSAENLTFANDYVYSTPDNKSNKSADALRIDANNTTFINCTLTGVQDTLYVHQGSQYFYRCQINGLVDYIYSGDNAKVLFNECILNSVYYADKLQGYIAVPKTAADNNYGLVFNQCALVYEDGCSGTKYLLSRPWGPDAMVTWINCFMGTVLNETLPYADMSGNVWQDARFTEYYSYGPSYQINENRAQISKRHANALISTGKISYQDTFIGNITTAREMRYTGTTFASDTYSWSEGDDSAMSDFFMEGYAESYGVSGGGLLKENSENYYQVATAEEFLAALNSVKTKGKPSVIELTADIGLGSKELGGLMNTYSAIIKPYTNQPLTHPTLKSTGVSVLTVQKMKDLTIFSHNGSTIKHANITLKESSNIMIRNLRFDELWEWDEATAGAYDRNDWDYMTIQKSDGIWIDHCSFYKAYDGVIDIKTPAPASNVTISWCNFLPGSKDGTFLDAMMNELKANPGNYPNSYQTMLNAGMTEEQIYNYAYAQKKTFLLGQSDSATDAVGIKATFANNYFANSMDRLPRLRYGTSHVYNTIMDSQAVLDAKNAVENDAMKTKFVSNGAASTCGAQMLLEGCYISGIVNALNSGNGSSPAGYINAINSLYYMDGKIATLAVANNTSADDKVLVTDATSFRRNLPYTYATKNAANLYNSVFPYSGAGKISLTTLQWEKTSYNVTKASSESASVTDAPENNEDISGKVDYEDVKDELANGTGEELLPEETLPEDTKPEEIKQEETKERPKEDDNNQTPTKKPGDTVVVNGKTYIVVGDKGDVAYRVAASLPETTLTKEVKDVTKANTIFDLETYLKKDLMNTNVGQVVHMMNRMMENMAVYDVSIVVLTNGGWVEATAANFPRTGLNVTIPYPAGTGPKTHQYAVSHMIVHGYNGKVPGTIEYLNPYCAEDGLLLHITGASPFTVAWERIVEAVLPDKTEVTVGQTITLDDGTVVNKWVAALQSNTSNTSGEEEDAASRARNAAMSTRFTIDSVMGSGYLFMVSFLSIAVMFTGNYLYFRYKRKKEIEEEELRMSLR